jgi:hypothetical protein
MTAIVLLIVGFVLGAILVARQREGHGVWGDGCINAHGYFLVAGSLGDRERAISKRTSNYDTTRVRFGEASSPPL